MQAIKISCPTCNKKGTINVDEEIIINSERGITAINLKEDIICKHSFVAYIDTNLIPRDYFAVDFTVSLPNIEINKNESSIDVEDYNDIDIYLISLNLHAQSLARIFRSIFLNQKVLLINEINILDAHLLRLLEYCFEETFAFDLSIISRKEYKKERKNYMDHIILSKDRILKDSNNLLMSKKMKIESAIVQKFLSIPDMVSGMIILKNEIYKAFEIAKNTVDYINGLSENEKNVISIYEISEHIIDYTHKINIKLQKTYLDFLIDIIIYYFNLDISGDARPENFLTYL